MSTHQTRQPDQRKLALIVGAIGVVYGDIGTSPLYALKEAFIGSHGMPITHDNILGVLSLIFWALVFVVSIKYVALIMRADNQGEGGIMALIALVQRVTEQRARLRWLLMTLGIFGAALFYGDGMITPAISVLSAVEGLEVATEALKPYVIPITLLVILVLFAVQRHGTARVGAFFGPVMIIWFLILAILGVISVYQYPEVLGAFNPYYAVNFFSEHSVGGLVVFGAVVLAVTGCEALYADMGHFGKSAIRTAWFWFVLPALVINYFGQGALLLHTPGIKNPFYELAPGWMLYPMVALSTCATVIASQAVISGAFSITRQAIQLGYSPRMNIKHTSEHEIGQIYIPFMNWGLLVGVVILVLGFQSSSALAAAYGIAVTGTMAIDTILAFVVVRGLWRWNWSMTIIGIAVFLIMDTVFFTANLQKMWQGGWVPILIALITFGIMLTWKNGRKQMQMRMAELSIKLVPFVQSIIASPPTRIPGTAIFLTTNPDGVPHALLHNLKHNKVLHERVVILHVKFADVPFIPQSQRVNCEEMGGHFYRVTLNYGFKDVTDVPKALEMCSQKGVSFDMMDTSFFLSRETLLPGSKSGVLRWRELLFIGMARNASSATSYFNIPINRVIELGCQIQL